MSKKIVYTLSVNDYSPLVSGLTFPLMKRFADKIGADFKVITERKFPDWPIPCEKFQIHELAQQEGAEFVYFWDADALIHPDMFDVFSVAHKDTVVSGTSSDFSPMRFKPDKYFLRDGRFFGRGNWMVAASDWCLDYWKFPDDITLKECVERITPIQIEVNSGVTPEHLVDDFIASRNMAKYGLKLKHFREITDERQLGQVFLLHNYLPPSQWMTPVADTNTGFTVQEFADLQMELGKPLKEFTPEEIKFVVYRKNLQVWKVKP
jgi:hypothetical protein